MCGRQYGHFEPVPGKFRIAGDTPRTQILLSQVRTSRNIGPPRVSGGTNDGLEQLDK